MAITVQENLILHRISAARKYSSAIGNSSEIYVKITSCLNPAGLSVFARTCRTWKAIVTDEFWHRAFRVFKPNLIISKISTAVQCEDDLSLVRNPMELYFKIATYLPIRNIAALATSCKMGRAVVNNDFWRYLAEFYFPQKYTESLEIAVSPKPLRGPAYYKSQLQHSPAAFQRYSHARIHDPLQKPPLRLKSKHLQTTTRSGAGLRRLDQPSQSHKSSSGNSHHVVSPSSKAYSSEARIHNMRAQANHSQLERPTSAKSQEEKGEEKSHSRRHVSVSAVQERAQSRQQVSTAPVQEQERVESRVAFGPHLPPPKKPSRCCIIL